MRDVVLEKKIKFRIFKCTIYCVKLKSQCFLRNFILPKRQVEVDVDGLQKRKVQLRLLSKAASEVSQSPKTLWLTKQLDYAVRGREFRPWRRLNEI